MATLLMQFYKLLTIFPSL